MRGRRRTCDNVAARRAIERQWRTQFVSVEERDEYNVLARGMVLKRRGMAAEMSTAELELS